MDVSSASNALSQAWPPAIPHGLYAATLNFTAALVACYYGVQGFLAFKSRAQSQREKSWVLTAISSAVMTAISLPYVFRWLQTGQLVDGGHWADVCCCFFIAYLICDLLIGSVHYRSSISVLTGWVHHVVYILLITLVIIPRHFSSLFSLCCILELSTFLLAVGNLNKSLRNDYLFASTFFLTRIVLHLYLAGTYAVRAMSPEGGTWMPTAVLTCVFPMHALWMKNCISGILRRRTIAQHSSKVITANSSHVSQEHTRVNGVQEESVLSIVWPNRIVPSALIRRSRNHMSRWLHGTLYTMLDEAGHVHNTAELEQQARMRVAIALRFRSLRRRVVGRIAHSLPGTSFRLQPSGLADSVDRTDDQ